MIIAIDFDGVLIKRWGIPRTIDFESSCPTEDAQQAVKWMMEQGHEVYILTARVEREWKRIKEWMKRWDFPELEITNIKKGKTHLLIDDRAVRFTNWLDICRYLG